ncbi:SDR family NAD(P)-dependent oxidoreductase [Deinococcus cellulosilyticus]|uniref:Dehydrogenase/reductase n=1 Tax=Deinococcus cellulosilyticus (strain DSM 18568 / NBRC 106333 / KACC 11606 / 5516J-15) TaxID=1223518 RepID=A0A511N0F4_DEIC1|nr:SDR family NAD(P)-dependent oxidoreductase [Deinococcus cellulosilyticus]GEM46370.1 dehydrogenase/reductase [Deinococcus cellulosilyticus NBRC 106333 = KACC 11606]
MSPSRTVLITGGTAGLGKHTAQEIAQAGWRVVITSRSADSAEKAAQQIRKDTGNNEVHAVPLDLADLQSVRKLPEHLKRLNLLPLQALIANAGLQYGNPHQRTRDGFEATFGTNHLGHVLLLHRLLPHLEQEARLILVSSGTHDPRSGGGYPPPYDLPAADLAHARLPEKDSARRQAMRLYSTSKLANLQTALHLARTFKNQGITVHAFDPGLMPETGLFRDHPAFLQLIFRLGTSLLPTLFPDFASTARRSGRHLALLVTDPGYATSTGQYFTQGGRRPRALPIEPSDLARDAQKAERLWKDSLTLVGEKAVQNTGALQQF